MKEVNRLDGQSRRAIRLSLDSETDVKLRNHARAAGVSPRLVAVLAIRMYLGLFPKR